MIETTFAIADDKWNTYSINLPKQSNWTCYAFGGDASFSPMTWVPQEGRVPNRFVRWMMRICFDCKWVKK